MLRSGWLFLASAFFFLKEDFFSYEKEAIEDGAERWRQSAGKAGIHSRLTTARSSGAAAPPFHKLFFLIRRRNRCSSNYFLVFFLKIFEGIE